MSVAPALRLTELRVVYGRVAAVDNVNLDVQRGELVAVIGPNGAGKSTMVDAVAGVVATSGGTVELDGRDITRLAARRRRRSGLARTHQTPALIGPTPHLEVAVASAAGRSVLAGALRSPSRAERQAADALLDLVRVPHDLRHQPVAALGLSTHRRVELARALASRPTMLLLDEPASGLSAGERDDFAALLTSLANDRRSVLLVEHDMALVGTVADRVVVLDRGRAIAGGPFHEVMADPVVRTAYLGANEEAHQ